MTNYDLREEVDSGWSLLYRVSGVAALLMAVFIPVQVLIFILWPPPATVADWFDLFKCNKLIGLLDLDLLLIVDQVFMGLILLALYIKLKSTNRSAMTIALALGLIGIAAYFASTAAFEMLSLSNKYAVATTEAERNICLVSGEVMLATWQGTAFNVGYVMEGIALLIIAFVMLQSGVFGKLTAWVGVVTGVMSLIPPTAGIIGMIFALGSLLPLEIWAIMVAVKLFRMAKENDLKL